MSSLSASHKIGVTDRPATSAAAMASGEPERPPLPPFETEADALRKVKIAEQAWNTRDPKRVSLGYTPGEASPVPSMR